MHDSFKKTALGIELGSTRIKAVLIGESACVLASGESLWENRFENGIWTYSVEDILSGIQACYKNLKADYKAKFGEILTDVGAIGVSAMMHGYLVLDKQDNLLVPFRTWRNNNAEHSANELTKAFNYPIPARWSIAHLYQAILNKEAHIRDIAFQTTLEGYVHYLLTGERVIGVGEASGMFPIDLKTKNYDEQKIEIFERLIRERGVKISLKDIFPSVLLAGESAGVLTQSGAKLLDIDGDLNAGIPLCPPEGDAGTGMVATNSIKKGTGNISAGTSIFGMLVLENDLKNVYPQIDLVTTPVGDLVAMVHCNNCTSEINAWADLFSEVIDLTGSSISKGELYTKLFLKALEGESDCGDLLGYNYISGENITQVDEGRPMLVRTTKSKFNLSNFMRMQIYSAFATLKIGLDILTKEEKVRINSVLAHGGIFKTRGVAQRFLASAINAPVLVNQTSNEGGAFGISVLALYLLNGKDMSLEEYLSKIVFKDCELCVIEPDENDEKGYAKFMRNYERTLPAVRLCVKLFGEEK